MPKMIVSIDGVVIKEVQLTKERTTLGRRPYNDIVIDNLAVSGEHAVLHMVGSEVQIEDLNSTNGSYVNGKAVKKQALQNGDVKAVKKFLATDAGVNDLYFGWSALQIAANSTALHDSTPVILEVKLVAANTFLAVPGFMNRSVRGSKLLSDVIDNSQLEKTHAGFRGAVWMRAAALALEQKRPDDAKRFLNNIIQNNAPQAEAARGMLKGVSQ